MKKTLFKGILALGLMGVVAAPVMAEQTAAAKKEWTFMVFLNADNNLDQFGPMDIDEMAEVGSNENVNIIVQQDRAYGKPCERIFVKKGGYDVVEKMGEVDMGSTKVYSDFVKWGVEKYPANHYAVVLWNHGSGWSKKPGTEIRGTSYDDESGNHITNAQLTEVHAQIKKDILGGKNLDILAHDACLMQMIEVGHAVKGSVDVMLASEEVEPGEGWAYVDAIKAMHKMSLAKAGTDEFATAVVDSYVKSYQGGSQGTRDATQSWVRLSKTDAVVSALNKVADALNGKYVAELKASVAAVQKFYDRSNVDLIHLLNLLGSKVSDAGVKSAVAEAVTAVKAFVGHSANTGGKMANANGVAIYFPQNGYSFNKAYKNLCFAGASKWDEMLESFYKSAKTEEGDLQ